MVGTNSLLLFAFIAGIFILALFGLLSLKQRVRKALLPMVAREKWTDAEYRDYTRNLDRQDTAISGSLSWQAHQELQRMTARASELATSLITWRDQVTGMDADAARLEHRASAALAANDEGRARQLLADRRILLARRAALQDDIDQGEGTLDTYSREISALEDRLGGDLRRESIAKARIDSARDTIRARQLMHGTLAEAAMAKLEDWERKATFAEAEVDALAMEKTPTLSDAFEELEIERDLEKVKARRLRAI